MSGPLNPYHVWAGLPSDMARPNYYELLGLELFEANSQKILQASDRVLARVRATKPEERTTEWIKLLDEVNAVRNCLLAPAKKAAYDASLRQAYATGVGRRSADAIEPGLSHAINTSDVADAGVTTQGGNFGGRMNLEGQKLDDGRIVVRKRLGEGGMGSVWLATMTRLNTDVVVKVPHENMLHEEGFKQRFRNEIKSLINLSHGHPNIVKIMDVGEFRGLPYAVMQFLKGGSLESWRLQRAALKAGGAEIRRHLRWIEAIGNALDFVHRNGLVHRDIKPQNILFDEDGGAYLADFGIAKVISEEHARQSTRSLTGVDQMVGTLAYMPYEVLVGETCSPRSDQFAFAVTVFEALSGKRPFSGTTPAAVSIQQRDRRPKSLHLLSAAIPSSVTAAVERALDIEPPRRFNSCGEFASAVIHAFESDPGLNPSARAPAPVVAETEARSPSAMPTDPIQSAATDTVSGKVPAPAPVPAPIQIIPVTIASPLPTVRSGSSDAPAQPHVTSFGGAKQPPPRPIEPMVTAKPSSSGSGPSVAKPQQNPRVPPVQARSSTQPPSSPFAAPSSVAPSSVAPSSIAPSSVAPSPGAPLAPVAPSNISARKPTPPSGGQGSPSNSQVTAPLPKSGVSAESKDPSASKSRDSAVTRSTHWRTKVLVCPWCWNRFSPSQLLWIAEHPSLFGDFKLRDSQSRDQQRRFLPEKFTSDCRAIDPMGSVCYRTACPNCHLVVPREMVDFEPLFVSVLGIPTSGKSCYLASMAWQLRNNMPSHFRYSFIDADAELNQRLIQNEQQLFMNPTNELVKLGKTDLFGEGYEQVTLSGQGVQFARPYIFSLRPMASHPNHHAAASISYAVCVYDNAGEHFLPGNDKNDTPVTRHLAYSDAIIFLFDPSQHPRFRQYCEGKTTDPQFAQGFYEHTVRQETVLVEAMQRIRRYSRLSLHEKYAKPLIVLVNKYDAWAARFEGKRNPNPWIQSRPDFPAALDLKAIDQVSKNMRDVMAKLCPEVVHAAEDMSSQVTYIPISSFGRRVEKNLHSGTSGVPPNQLNPMWVEVPMLYILSTIRKGVIPKA